MGKEIFPDAVDIMENEEDYVPLPDENAIDDYTIMEDFCYSVKNREQRNELLNAIRGRGAFHRFRDTIEIMDIESDWYEFRDQRYKQEAIAFCDIHHLKYEE